MHLPDSGQVRVRVASPAPQVLEQVPVSQSVHSQVWVEHSSASVWHSSAHGSISRTRVPPPHCAVHASHWVQLASTEVSPEASTAVSATLSTTVELLTSDPWAATKNSEEISFMPSTDGLFRLKAYWVSLWFRNLRSDVKPLNKNPSHEGDDRE